MFLRFCQILGISSGYLQGMFRVCSEYVQGMFRVCSGHVQSMFRVGSEYFQSTFGECFMSSSSVSSVSVFGIFFKHHTRHRIINQKVP